MCGRVSTLSGPGPGDARLSRDPATDDKFSEAARAQWSSTAVAVGDAADVEVVVMPLSQMPLLDQIELVASSIAMVSTSGGAASLAIFLPRGGTAVLLCPAHDKDDFVMLNHAAHMQVTWVEMAHWSAPLDAELIEGIVRRAVARYEAGFSGC